MKQDADDHREFSGDEVVVKANVEERQAVEVKPMRYVLGIGIALVIIGFAVSYLSVT